MKRRALQKIRNSICLLIAVCAFVLMTFPEGVQPAATKPVLSDTLAGHVVAVDAGHGGYDGGARAPDGRWEKVYNLEIALRLRDALQAMGATVVMTRDGDYALCDPNPKMRKKRQDMERRADLTLVGGAELLISIHMNEYRDRRQSGPQVFFRADCPASKQLSGVLQKAMVEELSPARARTALSGDFYMLSLGIPSALVECGFLSNPAEEALLRTEPYQIRVAEAIAQGVADWFALPATETAAPREDR